VAGSRGVIARLGIMMDPSADVPWLVAHWRPEPPAMTLPPAVITTCCVEISESGHTRTTPLSAIRLIVSPPATTALGAITIRPVRASIVKLSYQTHAAALLRKNTLSSAEITGL